MQLWRLNLGGMGLGRITIAHMMNKPRILLVEDESAIADTLQYVLSTDGFTPVWCSTAAAALEEFSRELPAMVVLDVGLPDLNGLELFRRLQALPGAHAVPMVFLTARAEEIDRVVGLELGADDYISKPFSPREFVARVRTVLRRSKRSDASAASTASTESVAAMPVPQAMYATYAGQAEQAAPSAWLLDEERHQICFLGQRLELSRYEYGVLRLMLQKPGHVFTRDTLLLRVWGDASDSFDRTVDAHIKTLRAKLKAVRADLEPIRTLRGVGYALNEHLNAQTPTQA
jgi:two-component system catabolic regulation response regulator CreB